MKSMYKNTVIRFDENSGTLKLEQTKDDIIQTTTKPKVVSGEYYDKYIEVLQQYECEKKLAQTMNDALENKVSELIAEI